MFLPAATEKDAVGKFFGSILLVWKNEQPRSHAVSYAADHMTPAQPVLSGTDHSEH